MPMAWPGSSAVNPGRAHVRMVTEVFNTLDARTFSKFGFETWSSQVYGILNPYKFWRIADCAVEVIISGGTASDSSVAFNVSNGYAADSGTAAVLNDDYSAVSTALLRPKLHPPLAYWKGRQYDWYIWSKEGDPGYNQALAMAGAISLSGSGGGSSGTVIGFLIADLVIEFHTLT